MLNQFQHNGTLFVTLNLVQGRTRLIKYFSSNRFRHSASLRRQGHSHRLRLWRPLFQRSSEWQHVFLCTWTLRPLISNSKGMDLHFASRFARLHSELSYFEPVRFCFLLLELRCHRCYYYLRFYFRFCYFFCYFAGLIGFSAFLMQKMLRLIRQHRL